MSAGSTGTTDASASGSSSAGPKFDLPLLDVSGGMPPNEQCPSPLEGTSVSGPGPLGDFEGKWGYFGGYGGDFDWFHIVLFDEDADLKAEEEYAWGSWGFIDEGPALVVYPNFSADDIPTSGAADAEHYVGHDSEYTMVTVTIEEMDSLDVPDPIYYMVGSIAPWPDENAEHPLSGPFVAVYCAAYDQNIIAE